MNSASRLYSFCDKIKTSTAMKKEQNRQVNISLFTTLQSIFQCETVYEVYANLSYVYKEISRFENEATQLNMIEPCKNTIKELKSIVSIHNLDISVSSIQQKLTPDILSSLTFIGSIIESDTLKEEHSYKEETVELKDFIEKLNELIDSVNNSKIENEDKIIFLSFLSDLQKGTRLYDINGIEALLKALQDSLCKYKLVEDKFRGKYQKFKDTTTYLIDEIIFWGKTVGKTKMTYAQLKNAVVNILENSENVIDAEVEKLDDESTGED